MSFSVHQPGSPDNDRPRSLKNPHGSRDPVGDGNPSLDDFIKVYRKPYNIGESDKPTVAAAASLIMGMAGSDDMEMLVRLLTETQGVRVIKGLFSGKSEAEVATAICGVAISMMAISLGATPEVSVAVGLNIRNNAQRLAPILKEHVDELDA